MQLVIVITSYNRWDFFKNCVESIYKNVGTNYKIVAIEDSTNPVMKQNIETTFPNIELIFNETNQGQPKSIDIAYNYVKQKYDPKYILKVEDDYLFTNNNPHFINQAIDVLETNPNVHFVWLRHLDNYMVSHGSDAVQNLFEPDLLQTSNATPYYMLTNGHYPPGSSWRGFTWMTSIHRMSDYFEMFPEGYDGVAKANNAKGVVAEYFCSVHTNQFNLRAAQLANGCCLNVGHNNTTY